MSGRHRAAVLALAASGLLLGPSLGIGRLGALQVQLGVACALVCALGWRAPRLRALGARLESPSPRERRGFSVLAGLGTAGYLTLSALLGGRDLFPRLHDEHSYLIQVRMLETGRLWMPAHPLAAFFESFHILVDPVYASIYFPGNALFRVPFSLLGAADWATALVAAGLVGALLFRIVAELMGGTQALLAVLALVAVRQVRILSTTAMPQLPFLVLALGLCFAWLRWRARPGYGWAAAGGTMAGWMAITRPVDAVAFALPVAAAALLDCRGRPRRAVAIEVLAALAAAIPFLGLQAVFDRGVTGSVFQTPYGAYARLEHPGSVSGFAPRDPAVRPQSSLRQKVVFFDTYVAPMVDTHVTRPLLASARVRLGVVALAVVPPLLWLLPVGLLSRSASRLVLGAPALFFVLLYAPNPFFYPHHVVVLVPALTILGLAGLHTLAASCGRAGPAVAAVSRAAVAGLCLGSLPELDRQISDQWPPAPTLRLVESALATGVRAPAIVAFSYDPARVNAHEEPVYNIDVAWPDDAPIIRLHDLGPQRNPEMIRYYAARAPHRNVYIFDRATGDLWSLGTVADLARNLRPSS